MGSLILPEMSGDGVDNLRLQIAQVFALCCDAARTVRRVSAGDQPARFFVTTDLETDLVHFRQV
ncbi:MAG TPA: hypothetical protein VMI06_15030 [Terriglobia bacterium]|nr:hypothetical protein [Terriglobia bacterium]